MPILYNCRHSGDQYRITKFDEDMNVESSYLCTEAECECPAGQRPTCRHRQMIPRFIQRKHIGDEWFFDYDRGGWVQMGPEWISEMPPLPEGITMVSLDNPADLYNAIAEAVGEPTIEPAPDPDPAPRPKKVYIRRRI